MHDASLPTFQIHRAAEAPFVDTLSETYFQRVRMRIMTCIFGGTLAFAACLFLTACSGRSKNQGTTSSHSADLSSAFAQVFCSVLNAEPLISEGNKNCSDFMTPATSPGANPPVEITSSYRLLLVPGYMDACFTGDIATFSDTVSHLQSHKVTADIAPTTGLGSSAQNAGMIEAFVNAQFANDKRPYIALGYSKGTPDLREAFAKYPDLTGKIAAFLTFAGVVKGSHLVNVLRANESSIGSVTKRIPVARPWIYVCHDSSLVMIVVISSRAAG